MITPSDIYVQGIYSKFSYFATWLPNASVALGDVGMKHGRYFLCITSLKDLNLPFRIREGRLPLDFDHSSQLSIFPSIGINTGIPPSQSVGARMVIESSQQGAFLFKAAHCLVNEIEDKNTLGQLIIEAHKQKAWNPDWVVVDTLVKAGSTTIIISNSRSARIELSAKGSLSVNNLADSNAGLTIHSQQGDLTQFLAQQGLTPLFRLSRVKRSLLAQPRLESCVFRGGNALTEGEQQPKVTGFSTYEDLWEVLSPDDR